MLRLVAAAKPAATSAAESLNARSLFIVVPPFQFTFMRQILQRSEVAPLLLPGAVALDVVDSLAPDSRTALRPRNRQEISRDSIPPIPCLRYYWQL